MSRYDLWSALTLSYQWILAAHIIFVIFWIAGLFMAAALLRIPSGIGARIGRGAPLDRSRAQAAG